MVTILFFARLREQLSCEKTQLEITAPATIGHVRDLLILKNPHWAEFLNSGSLLVALNQTMAKVSQIVSDGDELAFFPPVTGG